MLRVLLCLLTVNQKIKCESSLCVVWSEKSHKSNVIKSSVETDFSTAFKRNLITQLIRAAQFVQ